MKNIILTIAKGILATVIIAVWISLDSLTEILFSMI